MNPIVTKCKHYFCERCAITSFKKSMKCIVCAENTLGAFTYVSDKIKAKMEEKRQNALEAGENMEPEEEEDYMPPQERHEIEADEKPPGEVLEPDEATQYILNYGK